MNFQKYIFILIWYMIDDQLRSVILDMKISLDHFNNLGHTTDDNSARQQASNQAEISAIEIRVESET